MIASVSQLKSQYPTTESDDNLERMLTAVEFMIRAYTNNKFHAPRVHYDVVSTSDGFVGHMGRLRVDDTIEVLAGDNAGLYTIIAVTSEGVTVDRDVYPDVSNTIVKVVYPPDVIFGALALVNWKLEHRDKVGVQSETISRHSVTYFNMDGENAVMGYPVAEMGFLTPYRKARF